MLVEIADIVIRAKRSAGDGGAFWLRYSEGNCTLKFTLDESRKEIDGKVVLEIDNEAMRAFLNEGIDRWLDKKLSQFSRWTFTSAAAGIVAGMAWFLISFDLPRWLKTNFFGGH
jgi:hypothetical protein